MSEIHRWRAAPFHAVRGRQGNRLASFPLSGERSVMPEGVFALLDSLRSFQTLAEHAETALRRQGTDSGIRKTLDDLRRQGLLISEEEFFRTAMPAEKQAPAAIETIAIPTAGRADLVARCVGSYTAHAQKYGHTVRFAIANVHATSIATPARQQRVTCIDRQRAESMVAAMGQAGIDPAVARFALLGEAADLPSGIARTTGANRNALLLECAGEAFLSVDDDTLCSFARSPSYRGELAIQSSGSPLEMWFGPDLSGDIAPVEFDFLKELGHSLGPAIRNSAPLSRNEFDHSTLEKLCRGNARSRLAQVGVLGDSATATPAGWLTATGPTRERLVSNEDAYRSAMASRRVFTSAPCETVSASRQLMGYCIGLDHREMLPPFPPLGRDQDGVFGSWERMIEPDSFTVHLPFSIAHTPAEERNFPPGDLVPPEGMMLNVLLHLLCEETNPGGGPGTPRERMQSVASRIAEIAGLPRADFEAWLIDQRLRQLSRSIAYLEIALKQFGSRPAWWVRDIQRFLRCWEEEMKGPDILRYSEPGGANPEDALGAYRTYARWCGKLLREWPAMYEAAMLTKRR